MRGEARTGRGPPPPPTERPEVPRSAEAEATSPPAPPQPVRSGLGGHVREAQPIGRRERGGGVLPG